MGENYKITATIDGSGCRSGINDIKGDLSGLDAHASKVGSAIGTALTAGVLAAGAAITGALAGGTKAFMDYEQSLANVSKTVDGTKEQIAALGENNRNLATSTGIAVTSLNGVSATLGSLGVAYKDIAATTELVSKGSIAFGMDAEEMATKVSKISTVYQVPIEQSGKYLSAMNALGNATAATEPQILSFTQAFGPMATMFNVPIEKVAAFGATLISSGVDAEEGATSIRSAIEYAMNGPDLKMDDTTKAQIKAGADHIKQQYKEAGKSTEEASAAAKEYENAQKAAFNAANPGNTRMTEWAKLLGTDVKSLNKMLNDDFLGTMAKSSKALETISSSTDRSKKAFDIWGSYGFKVMGTMSSQAGNLDKNLKVVYADIASGSKSMTSEFNRQNDTLNGSWNRVLSGVNDVGITIGQVTSGPVKKFFDAFIEGVPKIKEFTSALLSADWSKVSEMMASAFQSGVEQAKSLLTELGNSIMAQPWAQWFAAAGEAIINQPWGSWASQAINLLAAGLQAAISELLQIGDWIHDKLAGWISSDGPRQLGWDIANTIGNAINSWFNSDKSIWDSLSDVWGTVTEWAGIGWQIVKGIGQGLLDKMDAAVQPSANKLLASFATASYEIQGTFAKAWNTILIGAANLVTGIYSAFTGIGEKISGYLQPIVDKINEAYDLTKSMLSLGEQSASSGTIKISSYHDEISGGSLSPEAYSKLSESEKASGRYTANYKSSKSTSNVNSVSPSQPSGVTATTSPSLLTGGTSSTNPYLVGGTTSYSSAVNTLPLSYAGYMTGGSGFVSSELQSAGDGKLYMITDKGDFVTLTGKETVASSIFDLIAPYTADYVTNAAEAGQAWADQVMPVATEIKSSSSEAATTTKTAAKDAAEQTKLAGQTLNTGITSGADLLKQDMYGIGSFLDSITNKAGNAISAVTSTATSAAKTSISLLDQTSRNALTIGNSIVGSFTSGANAVQIGLNEAGQRIAVIGSVAQQNASQGGIALLGSISQGSAYHTSAMKTGGQVLQLSALMSGQSLETGGANAGASLTNAANKLNQWGGNGNVPYGPIQQGTNANVDLNGADVNGEFQDLTCTGNTVNVNALKITRTDLSGNVTTTYSNPLEYNDKVDYENAQVISEGTLNTAKKVNQEQIATSKTVSTQAINTGNAVSLNSLMTSQQANQQTLATNAYASQSTVASSQNFANTVFGVTTTYASTIAAINAGNIIGANSVASIGLNSANQGASIGINAWNQGAAVLGGSNTALSGTNTQIGATNTALSGTVTQLSGVNDQLSAQQAAITSSVNAIGTMTTNIIGLANSGGGSVWGGTSISGGGSWIGTGSTMVGGRGYTSWGGTAASNALSASGYVGSVHIGRYARGGNPTAPTLALMAEQGEEMVLPHDITMGLKDLIATGSIGRQTVQLPPIEPADIILDGRKIGEVAFKYGTKGIQAKGDFTFR